MRKGSFLIIVIYVYVITCVLHSSYSFYKSGKDYFFKADEKKEVVKDSLKPTTESKQNNQINIIEKGKQPIGKVKYTFLKNSNIVPIENTMIMNNSEFYKYKTQYERMLNTYFSYSHLRGLKEIVLADAEAFSDNSDGITMSIDGMSYMVIATKNQDSTVIIHEALHVLQAYYIDIFDKYYKKDWLKCKDFVSEYAKTNIYEDFAETGTKYLIGDTSIYNKKFIIFEKFYNQINNIKE